MKRLGAYLLCGIFSLSLMHAADTQTVIKLRFRTRADIYKQTKKNGSSTTEWMNLRGYGDAEDECSVELSNPWAGAYLNVNVNIPESSATATDATETTDFLSINKYYGWAKIGNYWTVTAGKFSFSNVPLANWASTEISLTGLDEFAKPGINKNMTTNGGQRLDYYGFNFSYRNWQYPICGYGSSTFAGGDLNLAFQFDTKPFMFRIAAVESSDSGVYHSNIIKNDTSTIESGLHTECAVTWPGVATLDLIAKAPVRDQYIAAAFLTPAFLGPHVLTFGFTYVQQECIRVIPTTNTNYNPLGLADAISFIGYAADMRLGLRYGKDYRFVLMANYSHVTPAKEQSFWDNTTKPQTSAFFVAGISAAPWEHVTLKCDAALQLNDLDDNDKKDKGENQIKICPSIKFSSTWQASVNVGLIYTRSINNGDLTEPITEIEVPLVFRVMM